MHSELLHRLAALQMDVAADQVQRLRVWVWGLGSGGLEVWALGFLRVLGV